MDGDSDMDISNTPPELRELATTATLDLLPQKSRILYEKQYNTFKNWRQEHNVENLSENILLAYFSSKASNNNYKSSTLWSIYSMLKSTLAIKENVNISKFPKLIAFLKKQSVGYKAKKSRVFSRDEINRFLRDAPDETYLLHKLCLIIGIAGACRRDELRKITTKDIVDQGDMLVITIPDSKNGKRRVFTVTDELCDGVNPLEIFRQYTNLRPNHCNHNIFFINYKLRKCTVQVVGVHTFAKIPSLIAKYLKLPNELEYTGHCYRRTSATLLVNAGADILSLKQHGGWKSSTVAEGYIEDSFPNKINVSKSILTGKALQERSFGNGTVGAPASEVASTSTQNQNLSLASSSTAGININNSTNYNYSRVILDEIEGEKYSDYINASHIEEQDYQIHKAYIATHDPKKNTISDFWRMVWKEKVTYIVMIANDYKKHNKNKERYWPNEGEVLSFGEFMVVSLTLTIHAYYECRCFELIYQQTKSRRVIQLYFKGWPNEGTPLYPQNLVPILEKMSTINSDFPVVVHCSDGVGATGTVILCDICLRRGAAEGEVDVLATLDYLRDRRPNMVDNIEQFKLAHFVILNCLMGLRTSIPIDQYFAKTVEKYFQEGTIGSQLEYIRDCEWKDDAMKSMSSMYNEEMPIYPEKDRFCNILPDNTARVLLQPYPPSDPTPSSTYINAVRVDSFGELGRFIVTQLPLPNTMGDFWRLVAEKDISVVICLHEFPKNNNSFEIFFPYENDELIPHDTIKVRHVISKKFQTYITMEFELTIFHSHQEVKSTTVKMVQFQGWKHSYELPDCMNFMTFVEDALHIAKISTPTLLACYNGATACGLFIAMTHIIENIKFKQECDVCQAIRRIRTSRKQFVNTEEQLTFLYKAALLYVGEKFNEYSDAETLPVLTVLRKNMIKLKN